MKKKVYEKPAIDIVEFEQQACLLAGSEETEFGVNRGNDYGTAIEEEWN